LLQLRFLFFNCLALFRLLVFNFFDLLSDSFDRALELRGAFVLELFHDHKVLLVKLLVHLAYLVHHAYDGEVVSDDADILHED